MNCTGTIYSYISFSFLVFHTISIFYINFHKREREWGGSPEKKILQWLGINIFTTKMFFDSWKVSSLSLGIINNKIHVYFTLYHMTSTPPFFFTNLPRFFLCWNIKNMFRNISVVYLFNFLSLLFINMYSFTYCANKHPPPPFNRNY